MKHLLEYSFLYRTFRDLTGARRLNNIFASQYIAAASTDRVLDLGCGPADILEHLTVSDYVGIDINPRYIETARARFGTKGQFLVGTLAELQKDLGSFDRVIALGVLHHLPDQVVTTLLSQAQAMLKSGGYFVSYDPCFVKGGHPAAQFLHWLDRGQHVRYDTELTSLAQSAVGTVKSELRFDLCRIPSSVVILRFEQPPN